MAHVQHVALVYHNLLRIAAEGVSGRVCRGAVVGENHMVAVVFQSCLALCTLFTAVDHTADADQVAHVESRDLIADGGHLADDFMSRHARIERTGPFGSRLMKVGVADAAVIDGNLHIVGPRVAAGDSHRFQRLGGGVRTNSIDLHSETSF